MSAVQKAAVEAHRLGYTPLLLKRGEKRPEGTAWGETSYADAEAVSARFAGAPGIGLLLGGGLADVDLDTDAACDAAPFFLPETPMKSGRASARASHWWYSTDADFYKKHWLQGGATLVELRADRSHQTVVPPSRHPSGEAYEWEGEAWGGEAGPAKVPMTDLRVAVAGVAVVAALLDHWPSEGSRNAACLALAGWMLRNGGHDSPELVDLTGKAIEALALLSGDEEASLRVEQTVPGTAAKLADDKQVHGWTELRKIIGVWDDVEAACFAALDEARSALGIVAEARTGVRSLADGPLAEDIGRVLAGQYCWSGGMGWTRYDGKRWQKVTDVEFTDKVRTVLKKIRAEEERKANGDMNRLKALVVLLARNKIGAVASLARGILECPAAEFDNQPDLLNCANGVVDLQTGELLPHDPGYRFTQITPVRYVPGAKHPDWDKALRALPADVLPWWQRKLGQAVTGYAASDDILPICRGGGENGKTTLLLGVKKALGEFCVPVPDKLLLAKPGDHPTEIMTLKGTRVALLEELPEGDYLDMNRVKRLIGTETGITARHIGKDNVTWQPTHCLFVTTNYDLQVKDVDHGTWRRLALVEFPYRFDGSAPDRPGDPTLRDRIRDGKDGQHEAVLAWLVAGAQMSYLVGLTPRDKPATVREATDKWRRKGNLPMQFVDDALVPDPGGAVRSSVLYDAFRQWLGVGRTPLGSRTFWERAKEHDLFREGGAVKHEEKVSTKHWRVAGVPAGDLAPQERLVTGVALTEEGTRLLGLV